MNMQSNTETKIKTKMELGVMSNEWKLKEVESAIFNSLKYSIFVSLSSGWLGGKFSN